MRALLAKIPRDRSLLLLLAPPLVLIAFLAAGRSEEHYSALPIGATVPESTTSTTVGPFSAEGAAAAEQAAEVEGTSVSRSGTTTGSGSGSSGSSGTSASRSTSTPGGSSGASGGSGGELADGAAVTTTTGVPAWVDGASTTTTPGTTTTSPGSPTTTVPGEEGPDPAVDEVPIAILLPVSAVLVLGLAWFVVARRRRSAASPARPPTSPTTGA